MAVLFLGLDDNSRTKRKIAGTRLTLEQTLLGIIYDAVNFIAWSKTKSAQKGQDRPESIINILQGREKENEYESFTNSDELMAYFDAIEKGEKNGN